jgi:hypothetical protein
VQICALCWLFLLSLPPSYTDCIEPSGPAQACNGNALPLQILSDMHTQIHQCPSGCPQLLPDLQGCTHFPNKKKYWCQKGDYEQVPHLGAISQNLVAWSTSARDLCTHAVNTLQPFSDWQLLYLPPGLTFKNHTWCSFCVQCFVRISEQTATFVLYTIN